MALEPILTDPESMDVIMEAEAGVVQGMSWFLYNTVVPGLEALVAVPATPTAEEVQDQVAKIKTILCGYTAKECAMAELIKAVAKKTAVDNGIDPTVVCDCFCDNSSC
ncbi:hypothetical protein [Clostridium sp. DL1XJH146]